MSRTQLPGLTSRPGEAASSGGGVPTRFLASIPGGLALVLLFRGLYLVRFGGDPCWMNLNFLLEAKAVRFGNAVELRMPLSRIVLYLLREAGASTALSLGAIYLVAHSLLAVGIFWLGRAVLRNDPRVRAGLAIVVAGVPMFATDSGYRNIACTLGAALFVAIAALLVSPGRQRLGLRLCAAVVLGAGAASCRPESALCVAGLAALLALAGSRVGTGRLGAAAAGLALLAGIVLGELSNRHLATARGSAGVVWGASYSFYAFYNSSPLLLRLVSSLQHPGSTTTEYLRYLGTVNLFGSFADNHGSITHGLVHHPGNAVLWLLTKPFDLPATIVLPDALTPIAALPLWTVVQRLRREGLTKGLASLAPWWVAFATPLLFDLEWTQGLHAPYLLFLAPFLLLLAMWGIEPWIGRASAKAVGKVSMAALLSAALFVGLAGSRGQSTSPVVRTATEWLENRCADRGCLVNALPQPMEATGWADFQAGAPLPAKDKRAEGFVFGNYPKGYRDDVLWSNRVARAIQRGWNWPILYVRPEISSFKCWTTDFDPEHRLEGEPRLDRMPLLASFQDGTDRVDVFDFSVR